jgi:predicted ATP-dependent serine protease
MDNNKDITTMNYVCNKCDCDTHNSNGICDECAVKNYKIIEEEYEQRIITKRFVILFKDIKYEVYKYIKEDNTCNQYDVDEYFSDESQELFDKLSDEDQEELNDIIFELTI